jgi:hypothetical protein
MEAKRSSEMSVLIEVTRCDIQEDSILHTHRRVNLKSYIALTGLDSVAEAKCVSCEVRTGFLFPSGRHSS